ncbi:MFS transporter [Anaerobacillus sp. CMMVII]|uniref:MFS transporter n=1 Tax=Anaerobacillus sp. CMMVII TaxID=2755588 RepID=UPI0021B833A2|nr:MFS transporter [Anaerobacillus sp. CMMVII]MCT8138229.1 MFS transporter [Anaerobacillus sp. CMMVII]
MIELKSKAFWQASIALGLASFIAFANLYYTQPILPLISLEFSVSPLASSLTVSSALLSVALFFFFFSALSDALGRKKVMMVATILLILTTFAIAFVQSFHSLLVLRILQGAFIAGIPTIAIAYIGEEFSPRALGVAIGIYISMNSIGGMSGRVLSGVFTEIFNWRISFILIGLISLVFFVLFMKLLPPSSYFKTRKFERHKAVGDYFKHLKNQNLQLAFLVGGLHFFIFVGLYNYVTYLLTAPPFLLPTVFIGVLFLTYLPGTISSTLAGKTALLWSQSVTIGLGIILMVTGTVIMLFINLPAIIAGLLLLSFGFFFAHSALNAWVSKRAFFAKASASGLYLTSYYVGGSLGSFYLGFFWHYWHWPGVIAGTLLVLLTTSLLAFKMVLIEHKEKEPKHNYQLLKVK